MSFVIAAPEVMAAAATDLANIGSSISAASAAAAGPTMGILAAGADEVSVAISALFGSHAQGYQTLSAQLAAYHNQFVRALNAGAGSYASAEAANVQQTLLNAINAPTQTLLGRPLIGNGAPSAPLPIKGRPSSAWVGALIAASSCCSTWASAAAYAPAPPASVCTNC